MLLSLAERPNVWVKVSGMDRVSRAGPPYEDALPFAQALVERIPERVLWGTDWPHPNHAGPVPDDFLLRDLVPRIPPDLVRRRRLRSEERRGGEEGGRTC